MWIHHEDRSATGCALAGAEVAENLVVWHERLWDTVTGLVEAETVPRSKATSDVR